LELIVRGAPTATTSLLAHLPNGLKGSESCIELLSGQRTFLLTSDVLFFLGLSNSVLVVEEKVLQYGSAWSFCEMHQ
jgi:hypothetical protein